jgi:DUF4097 and DUF4098 domain-containing protein YvlB
MREESFATPGRLQVIVNNEVGLVVITTSESTTTSVSLEGDSAGAEELIERATIECRSTDGSDVVRVKIPRMHGMKFIRRNGVTVRITTPDGCDVDVTTASADVELNGSFGGVTVKSASADITVDDAAGDLRAKTASGDISVGTVGGELTMHSASGDVRCVRVDGRSSATSTSGSVEVGSAGDRVDARSTSGDVRLGDVAGDASIVAVSGSVGCWCLRVRAISGNIELGVARGTRLVVDAETMSGTVQSDIPLGDEPTGVGESGAGGPEVDITARSVSGNVLVHRAAEAAVR